MKHSARGSSYFQEYLSDCICPSSRAVVQFMMDTDAACDLFELCGVDCLLEIMFLGTLPQFRGKGVATKLCEVSVTLAHLLKTGRNIKLPVDNKHLHPHPVPKLVSAIFTSFISQKIGKSLGFQIATSINYEKFVYNGQTYASKLGSETTSTILEYKYV